MSYGFFASYYDELMADVDYNALCEYLFELISHFRKEPHDILDLACGTGTLASLFAKRGLDVTAVDVSPEMLSRAKSRDDIDCTSDRVLFLCQDMRELDLYGTVECAVCTMDSVNHIGSISDLTCVFSRLHLFIEPGGIFVFDVNTPYKHSEILADNAFVFETDRLFCSWQNDFEKDVGVTHITLDFFERRGDNYLRTTEEFDETIYTSEALKKIFDTTGFELLGVFDEMSFEPPKEDSQRVFYVTRRKEDK